MFTFSVTREALSSFYAAPLSLMVSADIFNSLKPVFPTGISVFCLREEGVISLKAPPKDKKGSKDREANSGSVALSGMPTGLLGIVTSEAMAKKGDSFCEFVLFHGAQKPEQLTLEKQGKFGLLKGYEASQLQFIKFTNNLLANDLVNLYEKFGKKEQQLVSLRRKNEELWLGNEKAKRMIAGIGFSTRSVSFELLPGEAAITFGEGDARFSQVLPTDLAGFTGLALYLTDIPEGDGSLSVSIARRADDSLVGKLTVPFSLLKDGWNDFSTADAVRRTFGDGIISISYNGEEAPKVMLADQAVDRFGLEHSSIAIRVYKGLEDTAIFSEDDFQLCDPETVNLSQNGASLMKFAEFVPGPEEQKRCEQALGGTVLYPEKTALTVRLVQSEITGFRVSKQITPSMRYIKAMASRTYADESPLLVALIAGNDGKIPTDIDGFLNSLGPERVMSGQDGVLAWTSMVLSGDADQFFILPVTDCLVGKTDLVFAAKPLGVGKNPGVLQWKSLEIEAVHTLSADNIRPIPEEQRLIGENRKTQVRVSRFSELVGRVEYYAGQTKKQQLADKHGFSPLMVNDGTGAMQTHPLADALSASIMAGGAVVGARQVMAEIGTGHEAAPSFTYILMVIPTDLDNRQEIIEEIAEKVALGMLDSRDEESGVFWSSQTVPAMFRSTLTVEFDRPRTEAGDVVFAVLPINGDITCGWCNWYMFANLTDGYEHPLNILDAPEGDS
ncbi:hypothetical protein KFE96_06990 [Kordiimonas sp. SCSIO 12603]|uniref:DUF6212 domain-containing protein n=1 Tax=Kordiimonas sp. SCSIO 12603 TaxID=2829596 RepID=UPI0021075724|nr:DUF6212 domain-containing protein [Kordiimonas sp. SCSIO 12603]UTW60048.1 hypothetical protein KFE96_06990 [Kordiimonas sp. SCSIO 12603]